MFHLAFSVSSSFIDEMFLGLTFHWLEKRIQIADFWKKILATKLLTLQIDDLKMFDGMFVNEDAAEQSKRNSWQDYNESDEMTITLTDD